MALRVTQGMMSNKLIRNINTGMVQLDKYQSQMSTGRKINKPSDDPVGITYAMRYRNELTSNEQYQKNVDSALSWLDFSDQMLGQVNDIATRLKELTVQGSNGSNPQGALDSIRKEVLQLKEQLVQIGNSQINGKYVFNGQTYDVQPYDSTDLTKAASATPDTGDVVYQVGAGAQLPINVKGKNIFGDKGETDNVFAVIDRIALALQNGEKDKVLNEVKNIESRTQKVLSARSELGAKVNRVELMEKRLGDLEINLTELQSKTEDADMAKLIVLSKSAESVYQAALSTGAKIITPTLVDYIR